MKISSKYTVRCSSCLEGSNMKDDNFVKFDILPLEQAVDVSLLFVFLLIFLLLFLLCAASTGHGYDAAKSFLMRNARIFQKDKDQILLSIPQIMQVYERLEDFQQGQRLLHEVSSHLMQVTKIKTDNLLVILWLLQAGICIYNWRQYLLICLWCQQINFFYWLLSQAFIRDKLSPCERPMVLAFPLLTRWWQHALSKLIAYYSTKWIVSTSNVRWLVRWWFRILAYK